ncbi:MAG: Rpn family recombination-promoting nuclease/putative transposase [Selenomonadaceae bacterium]|nr:Rpn family recombination-promoting nuclease/putative transposase [Selenomonadaceae bacterium]
MELSRHFSEGNNQYRDSVFCHYFNNKTRLLSLCNAILNTDYKDTKVLDITTLSGVFFNGQKNDISCTIESKFLVLAEHQSSVNENMPFRCLSYVVEILNNLIENKKALYKNKLIAFPSPEFVVLYNGKKNEPTKRIMRLSDAFSGGSHSLELIVKAYNINYGISQPLIEKCKYLHDYSFFVDKVKNAKAEGLSIDNAIKETINYCITHDIMKEYLEKNAKEVFTMARLEWNFDDAKAAWREEAIEEGIEKGMKSGEEKATGNMVLELLKAKQPLSLIMQVSKYSAERITEIGRTNGIPLTM